MAQPQWPVHSQAVRSGVASIVENESPLAYYFYCAMHCLNMSVSAAVKKFQLYKM